MKNQLTVIVPFFNEEEFLKSSVTRLVNSNNCQEVILVDDKSTDKSLEIGKELEKNFKNIKLISKNKNEGKGSCILEAKKYLDTTHVIFHDADMEYDPSDIPKLFAKASEYPNAIILGSRTLDMELVKNRSFPLALVNQILCRLFNFLNNKNISDIASGYILMPSEFLLNDIFEEKGFGIEVEILTKAVRNNIEIYELPINYNGRKYSQGKKIKIKDGVNILSKIIYYSKFSKK